MKIIISLVLLFSGLNAFEQATPPPSPPFDYKRDFNVILEKTKDKTSDLYYGKLLELFNNEDSTITRAQTLALMIGFTANKSFKPFKDMGTEKDIFDLNESGDYEEALAQSKIYLLKHPLSLRILKERSFSYHQLRNKDSAKYYMDQVDKIMSAMIYSGNGKTKETPIFSMGLADGEYFIPNVGMTVTAKSTLWNKNKHFLEVITALNDGGEHINYYFVIQHAKDKIEDEGIDEDTPLPTKKPVKKKKTADKHSKSKTEAIPEKADTDSIPVQAPTDSIPLKPATDTTIIKL